MTSRFECSISPDVAAVRDELGGVDVLERQVSNIDEVRDDGELSRAVARFHFHWLPSAVEERRASRRAKRERREERLAKCDVWSLERDA